jgi:titin
VTGGLKITDYVIQYSADSGANWATVADAVSPALTATVRGLSNGTFYIFRVAAVTAGGTGAFSVRSAVATPFLRTALPAAPTNVTGIGGGGTVQLTWTASSANAGGTIRDYVIQYRTAAGSRWFTYIDGVNAGNGTTVSRLGAGRSYVFRVAARNLAGVSVFSSASAAITA